jgi:cytochrome b561
MEMAEPDTGAIYDRTTVLLHWAVALGVVFQWVGGRTIDWFPRGGGRIEARSIHLVLGAALFLTLAFRVGWRATRGAQLAPSGDGLREMARRSVHGALYLLLGVTLVLGVGLASLRRDHIMDWVVIPAFVDLPAAVRHALAGKLLDVHGLLANLVLGLAGLHAGAALFHQYVLRDGLLSRMGLRRARGPF